MPKKLTAANRLARLEAVFAVLDERVTALERERERSVPVPDATHPPRSLAAAPPEPPDGPKSLAEHAVATASTPAPPAQAGLRATAR